MKKYWKKITLKFAQNIVHFCTVFCACERRLWGLNLYSVIDREDLFMFLFEQAIWKMNCSAAIRGVSGALKQLQLFLVKLFIFIFFPLLLNICFDNCLIAFFADWTYVISICPKFTSPEVLFDWWYSAKYFSGCYALYRSHYFCRAISRYRLNQKVNMVSICTNL